MHQLFLFLFFALSLCNTITWTGNQNSFWHNPNNWNPRQIPNINDTALINGYTNLPLYVTGSLLVNTIINNYMIDFYDCTAHINFLTGTGEFDIYKSSIFINHSVVLSGKIRLIETVINVPLITVEKHGILTGAGRINGIVNNTDGMVKLEPSHSLYVNIYIQTGNLLFYLGNNSLVADKMYLTGNLYVYSAFGSTNQVIVKADTLYVYELGLLLINRNIFGNLTIVGNEIIVNLY